jgi:ribonuclease Z
MAVYRWLALILLMPISACAAAVSENCLEVVLTGTQGGPPAINGVAGAGTLVRYGSVENQCSDVLLQFDAGRGTTQRLSQLDISVKDLDAVFLTHNHSDHTEGLIGLVQLRWHFLGAPLDLVCSEDVEVAGRTTSCGAFAEHIGDAFILSGEIAQRVTENKKRHPDGPSGLLVVMKVEQTAADSTGEVVWSSGDVTVTAVTTTHIAGSLAFRVDTPAGSVVIGGDAGNSKTAPPRESSTSESVEALAQGADILVHSTIHPSFAPGAGSKFPPPVYLRQSNAADLGAMAERAGIQHLVMTHLIPALDSPSHGPFMIPGGPLDQNDFVVPARKSGFQGEIHVGKDLMSIRLNQ